MRRYWLVLAALGVALPNLSENPVPTQARANDAKQGETDQHGDPLPPASAGRRLVAAALPGPPTTGTLAARQPLIDRGAGRGWPTGHSRRAFRGGPVVPGAGAGPLQNGRVPTARTLPWTFSCRRKRSFCALGGGRRCMAKWRSRLLTRRKSMTGNVLRQWGEFATCSAQRGELALPQAQAEVPPQSNKEKAAWRCCGGKASRIAWGPWAPWQLSAGYAGDGILPLRTELVEKTVSRGCLPSHY